MPPSSDIYLVGAGRSSVTKQKRERNRFPQRNFYIGTIQIRTGLRFPVNVAFVQKYYDEIVKRIDAGTLLVEYKMDRFVDAEELKTLAFGSDAEKEAYEKKISGALEDKARAQVEAAEEVQQEKEEAHVLSVLGAQKEGAAETEERYHDGRLSMETSDNLDGSHEENLTTPSGKAAALQQDAAARNVAGETLPGQTEADVQAAQNAIEGPGVVDPIVVEDNLNPDLKTTPENEGRDEAASDSAEGSIAGTTEPELRSSASTSDGNPETTEDTSTESEAGASSDFKPLPDGWQKAPKSELLAWCTERGIDTSDMPSNKVLRERLDEYLTKG